MALRSFQILLIAGCVLSACAPSMTVATVGQTAVAGAATYTPMPSRTATLIPQATAQLPGGVLQGETEIGDQPGYASARTLAIHPNDGSAAVGWISWGANRLDDSSDGRVWVRVQSSAGSWNPLQTINTRPVKKFFGGLGLAITPDNSVHAVFGAGGFGGDTQLYSVESRDEGASWSTPMAIGLSGAASPSVEPTAIPSPAPVATTTPVTSGNSFSPQRGMEGGALALRADAMGGLHLLSLTAAGGYHLAYSYRAPDTTHWQTVDRLEGGAHYGGQLAVVVLPDGRVRRFVLIRGDDGARLTLYRSDDGREWRGQRLELGRFLPRETVVATSVLAVPRGASALVAVAWSQYAAGGVFAQISLDGGENWGSQERIAQHNHAGKLFGADGTGLRAGFEPSLVYEASTDQLVASWVELDLGPRPILGRTLLATRPLAEEPMPDGTPWHYAITPDAAAQETPPQLSPLGMRGALVGSADGRTHWLVTLDERNEQYRVAARPVNLAGLLAHDPS